MGVFVTIEGSDGSGKATQALELETRALREGYDVLRVGFPNYGSPSAKYIEHYLNGKYGPATEVHPELASMLYAVDRFAASEKIRKHLLKPHSLVVADRYVASNLAHQGTKFQNDVKRKAFYKQIIDLEYKTLGLPKPDFNVLLLVPTPVAQTNIDHKPTRTYTKAKRDGHERDAEHLERANANYRALAELYPDSFTPIPCMMPDGKTMRPVSEIHEDIWKAVLPLFYNRS